MAKENANVKKKDSKPKEKKRSRVKETFSELKKVTWPSFGTVVKQTGIVLVVVLVFLVVLMCFDQLLGWLYRQLVTGLSTDTAAAIAVPGVITKALSLGVPLWV